MAVRVIEQLEQLLRLWEDYWLCASYMLRIQQFSPTSTEMRFDPDGPASHWQSFRTWLLNLHQTRDMDTVRRYTDETLMEALKEFRDFPKALAGWSYHSRRVYTLDAEVQAILSATSLREVKWSDVPLPFPSFLIQLATPLRDPQGHSYDTILVSEYQAPIAGVTTTVREIRCIVRPAIPYQPLSNLAKELMAKRARRGFNPQGRGRASALELLVQSYFEMYEKLGSRMPGNTVFLNRDVTADWLVTRTAEQMPLLGAPLLPWLAEGEVTGDQVGDQMLRLVAGLPMYLRSLPPGTPHVSDWSPPPGRPVVASRSIVDPALVCAVRSCYELTREERIILGIEGTPEDRHTLRQLNWHFREGHWRRPPGRGSDPTYPKTVHVRHTMVRADRMPASGLPEGLNAET